MTEKLDRFTQRARQALTLAQDEALRRNHSKIDTEHLLLALVSVEEGVASKVLRELGCTADVVRIRIEAMVKPGKKRHGKPYLAAHTKRVIEAAVEIAHRMDHRYIGTEHLLVGLAETEAGLGAQVLQEFGTVAEIVAKVIEAITSVPTSEANKLTLTAYYARREAAASAQGENKVRPQSLFRVEQAVIATYLGLAQTTKDQETIIQEERNRLARDLHDSVKQQLFSISISAAAVRERLESDPAGALAALADVQHSAQAAMVEIDALLHQLSPAPLATIGLIEALREQCEAVGYRTGATVTTTFGTLPPTDRLLTGTQEALFRMAQEALSNVARHARASQVHVQLELVADENLLRLEVQDNGQGFEPTTSVKGMGLANLQARATTIGGRVELHSTPGQGTRVRIDIPLLEKPDSEKTEGQRAEGQKADEEAEG